MPKGRPALEPGHHGGITVANVGPSKYKARAYYRAANGQRYTMSRFGQTKAAARRSLEAALVEWQHNGGQPPLPNTRVSEAAARWLEQLQRRDVSVGTKQLYVGNVERYVLPYLGELRLSEASTRAVDLALRTVADRHGPAAAKSARAVLNGIFGDAVRHGALLINPVREVRVPQPRRARPRSLTRGEAADLVDKLRADPRAVELDLPDLVEFILATGCRVGEACAVRDSVLDLEVGTVEVNATIVRVSGLRRRKALLTEKAAGTLDKYGAEELARLQGQATDGLILQERPKTAAGWRVLALPQFVVDMVRRRDSEVRFEAPHGVVFGSPFRASLRDPSNLSGDFRAAFDRAGYEWATSHSLRKSVATWLDDAGWSARQIADQLGHAQPSVTLDVYVGRKVVSKQAAEVLDR